jgi:ABC-2 type transport system permease protein
MRKVWVIAAREYRAAVRSKAFIVTLVLMPVLMFGSIGLQVLFQKLDDTKEKKFVVIDRSGGKIAEELETAAKQYNETKTVDPATGKQNAPRIVLEIVPPSEDTPEAIARQRYELSQRVEHDEIEAIVEIGPKVFDVPADPRRDEETTPDKDAIRFQAKKPTQRQMQAWFLQEINQAVILHRLAERKLDPAEITRLLSLTPLKFKALTKETAPGKFEDTKEGAQIANFFLPGVLIGLMFMVIMVGATPAMQGIVEEKGQRIAEVLLGSVTPFQLMAGKLLGVIGVALTMATVYMVGGYVVADRYGVAGMLTPALLAWFAVMLVLALLIFGSLFIAVGAAAADIKDTQTLLMPIMLIACLPFFALGSIMQDPNGKVAVACSFFPFATPMLLVARQSVPPGVPLWQMAAGIALVLVTTLGCVWAAGRIFRVGILMTGKGAKFGDMLRWIWKG